MTLSGSLTLDRSTPAARATLYASRNALVSCGPTAMFERLSGLFATVLVVASVSVSVSASASVSVSGSGSGSGLGLGLGLGVGYCFLAAL